LLAGTWALGATFALVISFIAVAHVASGVASSSVAAVSQNALDKQSTNVKRVSGASARPHRTNTTAVGVTVRPPTVVAPPAPVTLPPPTSNAPPTKSSAPLPPPATAAAPARAAANVTTTATTSQGGTVWTRCTGPDTITFVAAVPRSGYQRTVDVESASAVEQQFTNGTHVSKVHAECSNGTVHAEVEDQPGDG
jgi:hypothetical protein